MKQRRYLQILMGSEATKVLPVISTSDPQLIDATIREINRRLTQKPERTSGQDRRAHGEA